MDQQTLGYILLGAAALIIALLILLLVRSKKTENIDLSARLQRLQSDLEHSVQADILALGKYLMQTGQTQSEAESRALLDKLTQFENRISTFSQQSSRALEDVRTSMERQLTTIRQDNNAKLDEMRQTVDEKLQKTLNDRMTESFRLVNERLEQVYRGLGEMQTLAQGVGDLKKVLGNVKTRGILGEVQLGAILEDILTPEQYGKNVATVPGSRNVVEYAVKLPVEDGGFVWLPIDAKFPGDSYAALRDAYDSGDPAAVQSAVRQLLAALCEAVPGVRIRLGSLEPRTIDEAFCKALSGYPNLCPQFHLSLQSGSDTVLKRMHRKYDTARYLESVRLLRQYFPGCAVTTDLIVGFPGETEEEFGQSLDFLRTCGLSMFHIFPYSRRKGTPAAAMPGQIPNAVKERRAAEAAAVAAELETQYHTALLGTTQQVLFEQEEDGLYAGHAMNYVKVYVQAADLHNEIRAVRITELCRDGVLGELE